MIMDTYFETEKILSKLRFVSVRDCINVLIYVGNTKK